jgi:glycosyltransferase involved in cell wall biosynthesis
MRVAFYAPLKPPHHPVPSGDRRIARLLMDALRLAGHEPVIASQFRSREPKGNLTRQTRLAELGQKLALRLMRQWRGPKPKAWLTYHLYYKAPDWIGPLVAAAWNIPYIVVEASYAPKRAGGPWDFSHRAVAEALRQAAAVVSINPNDQACLQPLADGRLHYIPPFLDPAPFLAAQPARTELAARHGLDPAQPWLLAVGMMRSGSKLTSYSVLAEAVALMPNTSWRLLVVGDGAMSSQVHALFARFGDRVVWLGQQDEASLAVLYASADLMVWPAIREAFGMALLEAQATGLPVVAGCTDGVPAVVTDGETGLLPPPEDAIAFAQAVTLLLTDHSQREAMGVAAKARVLRHHSLQSAADALDQILQDSSCRS